MNLPSDANDDSGIIKLEHEAYSLTLAPQAGCSILRFDYQPPGASEAIPLFRPYDLSSSEPINSGDTGYFPLVPFSNRIRDGVLHWQGQQYALPLNLPPQKHSLHGTGWQFPWQVTQESEAQVVLSYANPSSDWPFDYTARHEITLTEYGLHMALSITNTGHSEMPAGLGFHPYFTRTPNARIHANLPEMWAVDDEVMPTQVVSSPFADSAKTADQVPYILPAEHELDNAFVNFDGKAQIVWPEWGLSANISASEACKFLVIYSPQGERFFCVEPVTNATDGFNQFSRGAQTLEETGTKVLQPGETLAATMRIEFQQHES